MATPNPVSVFSEAGYFSASLSKECTDCNAITAIPLSFKVGGFGLCFGQCPDFYCKGSDILPLLFLVKQEIPEINLGILTNPHIHAIIHLCICLFCGQNSFKSGKLCADRVKAMSERQEKR